uniref:Uncharacterized protein n=1 Tax=Arundo donax TaxID=35708 RepID=A0A0A9CX56_ARUDO
MCAIKYDWNRYYLLRKLVHSMHKQQLTMNDRSPVRMLQHKIITCQTSKEKKIQTF